MANLQEAADELTTAAAAAPADRSGAQPVRMVDPPTPLRDYVITGTGIAAQVLLVLFLVFFLLSAGDLYKRKFVKLTGPSLSRKKITVQIIDEIREQIGVYLRTLVMVSAIVGIATWLAYLAVGMPNAAVWGLLAAVANVVPYVGPDARGRRGVGDGVLAFRHRGTGPADRGHPARHHVARRLRAHTASDEPIGADEPGGDVHRPAVLGLVVGRLGVVLGVPLLMAIKVIADRIDDLQGVGELLGD